jgi:glycosyltransferase involved in cell wall biosynthesis
MTISRSAISNASPTGRKDRFSVLFITNWFPRRERVLEGLFVREHARAVQLYDDVVVLHCAGVDRHLGTGWRLEEETDPVLRDGLRVFRLWYGRIPIPRLSYGLHVWRVVQAVRRIAAEGFVPDLIHANIYDSGVPAVVAAWGMHRPVVITEHYSAFPRNLLPWSELLKSRVAFALADRVLPVSESLRAGIEGRGLHARFAVIPNAVNETFFTKRSHPVRAAGTIRLLTVGQLKPVKGIPILLQALTHVNRQRTDWHLEIVGDGDERGAYQRLAEDLGIGEKVTFTPHLNTHELAARMRQAHAFVLASSYETFSVVTAEALASGLPVVATRCGGPTEFVVAGVGILVPPGDSLALARALVEMLDRHGFYDPEELSSYARARFSPEVVGRMLHDVYGECVKARRPRFTTHMLAERR